MRTRSLLRSPAQVVLSASFALTMAWAARAQTTAATAAADSGPHFALFTGSMAHSQNLFSMSSLGVSGDFHFGPIPVPLRLSASYGGQVATQFRTPTRDANASLELVMRPIPRKLGIQPYFLGGVGVATRTEYRTYYPTGFDANGYALPYASVFQPRQNWAFASFGLGLDIGRAFIQVRATEPIASFAPATMPVSFGFRFWD